MSELNVGDVTSPRWAGGVTGRNPESTGDYEELVRDAREVGTFLGAVNGGTTLVSLADAVHALLVENQRDRHTGLLKIAEIAKEREALRAENEKLRGITRTVIRRLEEAAQYCGDPQHPIWTGGNVSDAARMRVDGLIRILDPFRPELEDVDEADWDRVYKLDPLDAYVSDYEERAEARALAAEAELAKALQALTESRARYGDLEARMPDAC